MDLSTAIEGLRAAIRITKSISDADTALEKAELKIKLAELMSNLAEAQIAITEHRLDREGLEAEIAQLKDALEVKGDLERRKDALVKVDGHGKWQAGPFCLPCWETSQVLRSLVQPLRSRERQCPHCKTEVLWARNLEEDPQD